MPPHASKNEGNDIVLVTGLSLTAWKHYDQGNSYKGSSYHGLAYNQSTIIMAGKGQAWRWSSNQELHPDPRAEGEGVRLGLLWAFEPPKSTPVTHLLQQGHTS